MEKLEGETLEEFDYKLKKRNQPRHHKIWRSWQMKDYHRWLRKRRWKDLNGERVDEITFHAITRDLFQEIANKVAQGERLYLGYGLGKIEITKRAGGVKYVNGKLRNNYGVDWKSTIKLWYEDKEAMKKKQLVRLVEKEIFRITYNKNAGNGNYLRHPTILFMMLYPNRTLRRAVSKNIKEGKLDALMTK